MRTKIGVLCMVLGLAMLGGAIGLLMRNRSEDTQAGEVARQVVEQIMTVPTPSVMPDPYDITMREIEIDGYRYIGYVAIAALDLELPVMSDWSYPQLRIAPCRFSGATKSDDLVVMAHNYDKHFGRIRNLRAGDEVIFTDMDNVVTVYEVAEVVTLAPAAVEEMTAGAYDLTLFTCTYGGQSRVTVRCNEIAE